MLEKKHDHRECPHCHGMLSRYSVSAFNFSDGLGWGVPELLICFNDTCPIFANGWNTLYERYGVVGSQRFFRNPYDGDQGVLPAGNRDAMRGDIIEDAA